MIYGNEREEVINKAQKIGANVFLLADLSYQKKRKLAVVGMDLDLISKNNDEEIRAFFEAARGLQRRHDDLMSAETRKFLSNDLLITYLQVGMNQVELTPAAKEILRKVNESGINNLEFYRIVSNCI